MSYLEEFVDEAKKEIKELNNAVLEYEDTQKSEALEAAFRSSHTLKGNAAAMGFSGVEKVAHAIEDVFDEARNSEINLTSEDIDIIFNGIDLIEKGIQQIDEKGEEDIDIKNIKEKIRNLVKKSEQSKESRNNIKEKDGKRIEKLASENLEEKTPIRIHVESGEMGGVNALLVLESLRELYEDIQTEPEKDKIEEGIDSFTAYIDSPNIEEIKDIQKVQSVSINTDSDTQKEEKQTQKQEKEEEQESKTGSSDTDSKDTTGSSSINSVSNSHSVDEIESVRVEVEQLDNLLRRAEELVTSRIKLRKSIQEERFEEANEELNELERVSSGLQDSIMEIRLVPLDEIVGNFPRMVRDIARDQDKKVNFSMKGTDVALDRNILNELGDPLVHLLRNAVDHGIESPERRKEKGKSEKGRIELRARREHDTVVVEVEDDGRGIDPDTIIDKAVKEELITREKAEELEDEEVYDLMFESGFSTTEEVTEVSGRGVGMDVVRDFIEDLGSIDVESEIDNGTTIKLTLPVTISILDVLIVKSGKERYALPLSDIDKIERNVDIKTVEGGEVVENEEDLLSLIRLNKLLNISDESDNSVFIEIDKSVREIVLSCSSIIGIEEVVVKPLEGILSNVRGINGAAVLEEGEVVPVLDIPRL